MSLDAEITRLLRDALAPMLDERLDHLEDRLAERLAWALVDRPTPVDAPPPLLDQKAVARHLGVSIRTLQRMVSAGEFPPPIHVRPGHRRWRMGDVDAWLDSRRTP